MNGEQVDDVEEFAFLEAIVYKDGGGSRDIKTAAKSTRCIPETTEGVGSQRNGQKKQVTSVQDISSPVLLCGCETWKITKPDERKLNTF